MLRYLGVLLGSLLLAVVPANAQLVTSLSPPLTQSDVAVAISDLTPTYLAGFTKKSPGDLTDLLTNHACNAAQVGLYAVATNLFGATNEALRCGQTSGVYYWRPQRTDYAGIVSVTGGSMTLACLYQTPIVFINGSLIANMNVALTTINCWPGAQFSIANNAVLGVYSVTVSGLIGNTTKSLPLNGRQVFYFDGSNWQAF